jgi:hypothetical protein
VTYGRDPDRGHPRQGHRGRDSVRHRRLGPTDFDHATPIKIDKSGPIVVNLAAPQS